MPSQPYEKISHIHFLCSVSVSICIIIQTSILVFSFYFFSFLWLFPYMCCILYCDSFGLYSCMYLICYLVLWPPDWINATTYPQKARAAPGSDHPGWLDRSTWCSIKAYAVSQKSKPKYFSPQLQQTLIKVHQNW